MSDGPPEAKDPYKDYANALLELEKEKSRWKELKEAGDLFRQTARRWPLRQRWLTNRLFFRGLKNRYARIFYLLLLMGMVALLFLSHLRSKF